MERCVAEMVLMRASVKVAGTKFALWGFSQEGKIRSTVLRAILEREQQSMYVLSTRHTKN